MPPLPSRCKPLAELNGCRVFHGDCAELVATMGHYEFIFADPPFNIGQLYQGYVDSKSDYEYIKFTTKWIMSCCLALNRGGVLCLHGTDELVELYLTIMGRLVDVASRIAWINWHYRFGQCSRHNWIDARCHCLIYAKGSSKPKTWNPEAVLVESDRVAYGDSRIHDTANGGKRLPGTVWGVPSDGPYWGRVQGNNEERRSGHPNQLPEVYLARLIKAYTNLGDRILDPFGGSGTTAVVAAALGRKCDTVDISLANCRSIVQRLRRGAVRL